MPFGPIEAPVGFVQMRRSSQKLSAVGLREAWEQAERAALALLDQAFHLGGARPASREALHER